MSQTPIDRTSFLPNVSGAMNGWQRSITLNKVTQNIGNDGRTTDTLSPFTFQGVVQPAEGRVLKLYDENLRSWEWLQIHSFSGPLNLKTNDLISYMSIITGIVKNYKVMGNKDYSLNGYIEYHLVEDFQGNSP